MPLITVIGGASSGKSKFALSILKEEKNVVFVATGVETDEEMKKKIEKHKMERPVSWKTVEEPFMTTSTIKSLISSKYDGIIIDSITFWVSNLLYHKNYDRGLLLKETNHLAELLQEYRGLTVMVTDELGFGVIPESKEIREFRVIVGEVNQIISSKSKEVYLVLAGIPLKIKENI